jgi:mRNA interferase RelE/StbE
MKTSFNPNFKRDVRKTKDKLLRALLAAVIREIEAADTLADVSNIKKLTGYTNVYRVRVGRFRLGLYCENNEVELVRFLPRKDIYHKFP